MMMMTKKCSLALPSATRPDDYYKYDDFEDFDDDDDDYEDFLRI